MNCCATAAAMYQAYLHAIRLIAREGLDFLLAEFPSMDGHGGYLCSKFIGDERFLLKPEIFGETETAEENIASSKEQATRLEEEYIRNSHVSSFQSRDPEKNKFGGSVIGTDPYTRLEHIVSFSGLPEKANEALSTYISLGMRCLDLKKAERIAEISDNEFIRKILEKLKERQLEIDAPEQSD